MTIGSMGPKTRWIKPKPRLIVVGSQNKKSFNVCPSLSQDSSLSFSWPFVKFHIQLFKMQTREERKEKHFNLTISKNNQINQKQKNKINFPRLTKHILLPIIWKSFFHFFFQNKVKIKWNGIIFSVRAKFFK